MLIHNSAEKGKALRSPDQRLGCSQQAPQRQVEHPFLFFPIKKSNYEGPFLAYQGMKQWSLLWLNKWIMECWCSTRETRFIQILAGDCRPGWSCGVFFSVALCRNVCIPKSLQESYFGDVLIIQVMHFIFTCIRTCRSKLVLDVFFMSTYFQSMSVTSF